MTDSKPRNKMFIFALGFVAAAIAAIAAAFFIPYTASAQQLMSPMPYSNIEGPVMANSEDGSYMMTMPNITGSINVPKLLSDQVKVTFSDAANTAEGQVDGGKVIGGHIGIVQGYLVYSFAVANPVNQTCYMVVVDAGNGNVLYRSEGFQMGSFGQHFGLGGGPWGDYHKFGEMMSFPHHGEFG